MGHLIHCEKTDWMPRAMMILEHGPARPFEPLDREAQLKAPQGRPLDDLLDEFGELRLGNVDRLRALACNRRNWPWWVRIRRSGP